MKVSFTSGLVPVPAPTHYEEKFLFQLRWPCTRALCAALWIFGASAGLYLAQNILPDWDEGRDRPNRWQLVGTDGTRVPKTGKSGSALMVHGNGRDQVFWRTEGLALKPGSLYRLSFFGQGDDEAGEGVAFAGSSRVNRDFVPSDPGQRYGFVLSIPEGGANDFVRLGEWHVKGKMVFARAQLLPVVAIHKLVTPDAELGEGERVQGGLYSFKPAYSWLAGSYHRPLLVNRASFNSDRWVFASGAEIIYRLGLVGCTQVQARVESSINYYAGGVLRVDASRDGTNWASIATYDGQHRGGSSALPGGLFPAGEIFVRLSCEGTNANLQVNSFEYESRLAAPLPDLEGATHFMEVHQTSPEVAVSLQSVDGPTAEGFWRVECATANLTESPLHLEAALGLDSASFQAGQMQNVERLARAEWKLSCADGGPGEHDLDVRIRDNHGRNLFVGRVPVLNSFLLDRRPGYPLAGIRDCRVWWCESAWKIARNRPLPEMPKSYSIQPVGISAARGEYEPVQVILNPDKDCRLITAKMGPLRDTHGEAGDITARIDEVAYVRVTRPTDLSCLPGWYPDPLPPLKTPLELRGRQNQPLWITFYVAPASKVGDFKGELTLETTLGNLPVPVAIHVYDFTLPDVAHLKSAIGFSSADINRYHRLKTSTDKLAVYEQYLLDFAQHRLSPQSCFDYAPLELSFVGEGPDRHAQIDFSRFDKAAEKWLDGNHFNSFRLALRGIGSGTFQSRTAGELDGFKEGMPEYTRLFRDYLGQVEQHLRDHHWLDKAYSYWFDEPAPRDFDFVAAGMDKFKAAAPRIRRLLTVTPDPKLIGHVDIWCGLTYKWTPAQISERQAAGDEVWWYICTTPKAPYITEFIDHPGTELRLWPWQSWQHGVSGILIWNSAYWNSTTLFPEAKLQDPWADPMSYVSGSGMAPGFVGVWGNGDGRFLYPPRRVVGPTSDPCLDGPIDSIRWENLRDGMEDYEYFWLLQQAINRAAAAGDNSSILSAARRLLLVPADVSRDLTHFTTDPRPLLAHRDRVARTIEQLQDAGRR